MLLFFAALMVVAIVPANTKVPCLALSWAEKHSSVPVVGMEMGDATCAQAKAYGCADEIESMIQARWMVSCDKFVHEAYGGIPCCLFYAHSCREMRACLVTGR